MSSNLSVGRVLTTTIHPTMVEYQMTLLSFGSLRISWRKEYVTILYKVYLLTKMEFATKAFKLELTFHFKTQWNVLVYN